MQNEIIVNADPGETRVAVLERSTFTELHIERARDKSVVGSVIKGRVMRVLPGMQAAFVDLGLEKAAFLYAGDYFANGFTDPEDALGAPSVPQHRGRRRNSRQPPQIDTILKPDQEIVVQVAKQPIGTKGARIISHLSIPGRHLVLTPWTRRVGVSRRIDSDRERRRLREIVERIRPKDLGFIIRTAGDGVRDADIEADIRYLANVWKRIQERNEGSTAPTVLHAEPDLPLRMIRDFATDDTKRIVVDSKQAYESIQGFVADYVADPKPRIEQYRGSEPIFDAFGLEQQIHANLGRKVFLKSGGSLVIDQSEALTAIDVNTGRYVGKRDLEETVFKTNIEAVKEVVHQLRFRNLGGLIIIDLIDMESGEHRERVYRALQDAIRGDKARTNILKISELGLVEMTRKRTRENLVQTLCEPCNYCEGRGYVLSSESVAFRVLREIRRDLPRFCGRRVALTVAPQVAEDLLRDHATLLTELGEELGREVEVRARPGLHQEQFEVVALDVGPPVEIPLRWLGAPEDEEAAGEAANGKPDEKPEDDEAASGDPEASEPAIAEASTPSVEDAPVTSVTSVTSGAAALAEELTSESQPSLAPVLEDPAEEPLEALASAERAAPADLASGTPEGESPGALQTGDGAGADAPEAIDVKAESRILRPSASSGDNEES